MLYCHLLQMMKEVVLVEDTEHMQRDLQAVYRWAHLKDMSFNSCKFELIQYGKKHS